jgi:kynurenine--oxoglutarate transaminase/cysteine-S-conjugate beta-lyase/glutamine--phenylpyruvate transaminase
MLLLLFAQTCALRSDEPVALSSFAEGALLPRLRAPPLLIRPPRAPIHAAMTVPGEQLVSAEAPVAGKVVPTDGPAGKVVSAEKKMDLEVAQKEGTEAFAENAAAVAAEALAREATSPAADRIAASGGATVWSEFGALGAETGATNLGQGFPDWQPPDFVVDAGADTIREGKVHQYTRPAGHPPLVEVLAKRYSKHLGRDVDPLREVAVTVGASQALYLALQALLNPGDEVLLPEPAFDLYYGQVRLAGGTVRPVPLALDPEARTWHLDAAAIERAAATGKPKVLLLNTPHNPTGTVFSEAELAAVAEVVRKHPNLYVISDEVYKYTVYAEGASHFHFASLPGMFDRTVTLSSAGKTFSITGWQAGWCVGPAALIQPIQTLLPYVQFCVSAPVQGALARVLCEADMPYEGFPSYYAWLQSFLRGKRALLEEGVRKAGMEPMAGEGGILLMADTSGLKVPAEYLAETTEAAPDGVPRDWALCRWLAKEAGVLAIPASAFFSKENKHLGENYVRFAFCKSDETLRLAGDKLTAFLAAEAGN